MRILLLFIALATPTAAFAQPVDTATQSLTLSEYLSAYSERNNRLRARTYAVAIENVEVQRQTNRRTRELEVSPKAGGHLYHVTGPNDLTPLAEFGGAAAYSVRGNTGIQYGVRADVNVPTQQNTFAGNLQYAVDGSFFLPLIRNLGGREFEYQRGAATARQKVAEAEVTYEALLNCADGIERYVQRYAAQEKRSAYERLLKEKRRIWYRTAADYKKKLTTRLDLLSAKSDWLLARSLEPAIDLEFERADAALLAYASRANYELAAPPEFVTTTTRSFERHPRIAALDALTTSFEQEVLVAREQNRSELDLQLSAGVGRVHNLFLPPGAFADVTDIRGAVGLRYLLPIERPDVVYRVQTARLRMKRIEEDRGQALRELSQEAAAMSAAFRRELEALELLDAQIRVLRSQINAAYQEFRAGKLEFQNYLDHWDRYQQARLSRWDRWARARLAAAALVRVGEELPEVCRAQNH